MDSITKLRAKLSEATSLLEYVSKELEGYSDTGAEEHLNFAELKLRGEQYSFYEHPLTGKLFRDDYLALLIYLISLGGKKEEGWTVLYRIAAACDYQGELQNLTTDAMTFTEERLSDLIREIYTAELANIFAIDSLMISHHMGADDAQLKFLAGVYELLKLDKAFLTEAMEFVKVLDATYWDNPVGKSKAWKVLTAKDIATYIGGYPATSLEEAAKLNYKRIVISGIRHTGKKLLNLDDWKTGEILFQNCRFENCEGIHSNEKIVKFIGCTFDGNIARWIDTYANDRYYTSYAWRDKTCSHYRAFLQFNKAEFLTCSFIRFNDGMPMLHLNAGLIYSCNFKECSQIIGGSVLLNVRNAAVSETRFENCTNDVNRKGTGIFSYNDSGHSCMIYSANSTWKTTTFSGCKNYIETSNNYGGLTCILLLDKNSYCRNCSFDNNSASGSTYRSGIKGYTIELRDSKQSDNTGDFSVNNVTDISKDMFIVGDKHYDD